MKSSTELNDNQVGASITPDLWDRDKSLIFPIFATINKPHFVPAYLGQPMGQRKKGFI